MIGLILLGYLLLGLAVAWLVDRAQMDKEVPYGEFPSIFTLRDLRITIAIVMMIWGPVYVLYLFPGVFVKWFKDKYVA